MILTAFELMLLAEPQPSRTDKLLIFRLRLPSSLSSKSIFKGTQKQYKRRLGLDRARARQDKHPIIVSGLYPRSMTLEMSRGDHLHGSPPQNIIIRISDHHRNSCRRTTPRELDASATLEADSISSSYISKSSASSLPAFLPNITFS